MKRRICLLAASVALAVGVFAVPAAAEQPCHADTITYDIANVNKFDDNNGAAGAAEVAGYTVQVYQAAVRKECDLI